MTDPRAMEPFETRFADRVHAYTDPATERRIDALAISRTAMSSGRATGWSQRGLGAGWLSRRIAGARWAMAFVAVVFIGVVGVTVIGPLYNFGIGPQPTPAISPTPSPAPSATGAVPEVLRHWWQRPYAVTPGLDQWGSGFLSLAPGQLDFGPTAGDRASKSAVAAAGIDTLVATATVETQGCAIGETGAYHWSLEGQGTVMTLTANSADACAAREKALAGPWVRADLPLPPSGAPLAPGTYLTSAFDPFGAPSASGQLSYTVPDRWKVKEDRAGAFLLHRLPADSASQPSMDTLIHLFTQARMMADYTEGAICGQSGEAPGVGRGVDDIVAAILARPGVVATRSAAVTIGGYAGQMLDLHLAPTWTGSCQNPDGPIIAMPLLLGLESERSAGIGLVLNSPVRLILLDLTGGRTMAVAVFNGGPSQPAEFEGQASEAMPVIESFEFHPPVP
jgi:hypothetical protein